MSEAKERSKTLERHGLLNREKDIIRRLTEMIEERQTKQFTGEKFSMSLSGEIIGLTLARSMIEEFDKDASR